MSETPVSTEQRPSAGDPIPRDCEVIEIHVTELLQLFNAIDPSPFRERDLDPAAEDFIVGWAREAARDARLALVVYLDRPAGLPEEAAILRDASATSPSASWVKVVSVKSCVRAS